MGQLRKVIWEYGIFILEIYLHLTTWYNVAKILGAINFRIVIREIVCDDVDLINLV
jgi:hypothetical protein